VRADLFVTGSAVTSHCIVDAAVLRGDGARSPQSWMQTRWGKETPCAGSRPFSPNRGDSNLLCVQLRHRRKLADLFAGRRRIDDE
jgi:hypothetical protein